MCNCGRRLHPDDPALQQAPRVAPRLVPPVRIAPPAVRPAVVRQPVVRPAVVRPTVVGKPAKVSSPRPVVQREYNAEPTVWGPPLWKIVHALAHFSTTSSRPLWNQLIASLGNTIPCKHCRNHYVQFVKNNRLNGAPDLFQRTIVAWWGKLHTNVNKLLGKPTVVPNSYDLETVSNEISKLQVSFPPQILALLNKLLNQVKI